MRVFVTGATGFVGSAVTKELLGSGHQVLGLARSDTSAKWLQDAGAEVLRGDLEDLAALRRGASGADAVAHLGFIHDFGDFQRVCGVEGRALEAMGETLKGTNKPFVITSGTLLVSPGRVGTEEDASGLTPEQFPRAITEITARKLADDRVKAMLVRLSPSVHGEGDHGFVPMLIHLAREKGTSAYVGEGANRWTGVHRLDAAVLYRLALENGVAGARYHAADEEAIPLREIAEVIGKRLGVPVVSVPQEKAAEQFTWMEHFVQMDGPSSSRLTRERLGWVPTQPGLVEELTRSKTYFA